MSIFSLFRKCALKLGRMAYDLRTVSDVCGAVAEDEGLLRSQGIIRAIGKCSRLLAGKSRVDYD